MMGEVANYALIEVATGVVVGVIRWDGVQDWSPDEGFIAIESAVAQIGWSYKDGAFHEPAPIPPTDSEIRATNTSVLQQNNQLASQQKSALTNRISTLQDAIDNIGVEGMEDFAATPEEEAEFAKRKTQLTQWKNYAIALGRVTAQSGWALKVTWPAQPKDGMDLSTSPSSMSSGSPVA
jgi:hypothetical protein